MSASSEVSIAVRAGSPLAEVFLIDHRFALVKRSIGDLEASVQPGVYKAKARLGDAETERLVMVDRDLDVDLSEELEIASPAPLEGTRLAPTPQVQAARDISAGPAAQVGRGAGIFLMPRGAHDQPPPDVALLDWTTGKLVAGPANRPERTPGTTYEVAPGPYCLRWRGRAGVDAEQIVQAVRDWQTQVFVLEAAYDTADLADTRVSVLMGRHGFDPGDAELRRAEEARTALADERKVASGTLSETLFEKFENPMLGLFGAHLMLIARDAETHESTRRRPRAPVQFTPERFETVVHNLQGLLGEHHPDVMALATELPGQSPGPLPPLTAPPMLWRSWVLLIRASNEAPGLVPAHVWRPAAAPLPLRPFLIWVRDDGETARHLEELVAGALARSHDDDARQALTGRLLMPRAAVDAIAQRM